MKYILVLNDMFYNELDKVFLYYYIGVGGVILVFVVFLVIFGWMFCRYRVNKFKR